MENVAFALLEQRNIIYLKMLYGNGAFALLERRNIIYLKILWKMEHMCSFGIKKIIYLKILWETERLLVWSKEISPIQKYYGKWSICSFGAKKYHLFENIMENRAFALLEQMLDFP